MGVLSAPHAARGVFPKPASDLTDASRLRMGPGCYLLPGWPVTSISDPGPSDPAPRVCSPSHDTFRPPPPPAHPGNPALLQGPPHTAQD